MTITIDLISSGANIAPQQKQTIPKLELNGAVILSKLFISVSHDLSIPLNSIYAWTDSSVVLGQLQAPQSSLCVYVAHRVNFINSHVSCSHWKHVDTKSNPANLLSQGVMPSDLIRLDLWWSGPPWLRLSPWPQQKFVHCTRNFPDLKPTVLTIQPPSFEYGLYFSSFSRHVRVMGWVQRFICRIRVKEYHYSDYLTLTRARYILIKLSQNFTHSQAAERQDSSMPPPTCILSTFP